MEKYSMKRLIYKIIVFGVYVLLSACAPTAEEIPTPQPTRTEPGAIVTPLSIPVPLITPTSDHTPNPERMEVTQMPERIPTDEFEHEGGIRGEAPQELVDRIISDLQQKTGAARQSIQVIRAQAVVWNDGSLGCPKPGEFYTQALVNGFHIILKIEDKEYDYRASQTGYFFLCEGGARLIPSEGTTDS
jgi:hypothetical protein